MTFSSDCKAKPLLAHTDFVHGEIPCSNLLLRLYVWIVVEFVRGALNMLMVQDMALSSLRGLLCSNETVYLHDDRYV